MKNRSYPLLVPDKLNPFKKLWFIIRDNVFIVVLSLFVFFTAVAISPSLGGRITWSWSFVDPVIGLATLLFAFCIWFGESWQDYVQKLEKRLTIIFLYPPEQNASTNKSSLRRIAILCEQAYLASESDLRAWSQQVAGNMVFDGSLKFMPFIREVGGHIEKDGDKRFRHYCAIFELRKPPSPSLRPGETKPDEYDAVAASINNQKSVCWLRGPNGKLNASHDLIRWFDSATCSVLLESEPSEDGSATTPPTP